MVSHCSMIRKIVGFIKQLLPVFMSKIVQFYGINIKSFLSALYINVAINIIEMKCLPKIRNNYDLKLTLIHTNSFSFRLLKKMNILQIKTTLNRQLPQLTNKNIELERLSGLTNITYAVLVDGVHTYVFKQYSKDLSHEFEHKISSACSEKALGPKCIFFNEQQQIAEFIQNARCPHQRQIVTIPLLPKIMQKIYKFHELESPVIPERVVTPSHYLFSEQQQQQISQLKMQIHQNQNYQTLLSQICKIIDKREEYKTLLLPDSNQNLKICHNDLNNLNILANTSTVYLIDYDYAGYNFAAYDLANMINETSIDYSKPTYPGFEIMKLYSFEEVGEIIKHYPGFYAQLPQETLKFMCVANLYWAIWSLKRVDLNVSEIFGIIEHGLKRIQLFHFYLNLILDSSLNKQ